MVEYILVKAPFTLTVELVGKVDIGPTFDQALSVLAPLKEAYPALLNFL